jgi:predicted O-linked N-acetylglucosamine transferase (SPINDLY family)
MGASLLGAIGMPELVTTSLAEYEALALELARAPERLAQLSGALVANKVHLPLFDGERFRQHLEAAYSEMSRASRAGEPPSSFAIEPASSSAPVTPP